MDERTLGELSRGEKPTFGWAADPERFCPSPMTGSSIDVAVDEPVVGGDSS